jgi:hypothetical protein
MKIECYLSLGCGAEQILRENIYQALAYESVDAEVTFYRVSDIEAEKLGLKGSPSIIIDGNDIQPVDIQGFS